jgi:hypothetical protein
LADIDIAEEMLRKMGALNAAIRANGESEVEPTPMVQHNEKSGVQPKVESGVEENEVRPKVESGVEETGVPEPAAQQNQMMQNHTYVIPAKSLEAMKEAINNIDIGDDGKKLVTDILEHLDITYDGMLPQCEKYELQVRSAPLHWTLLPGATKEACDMCESMNNAKKLLGQYGGAFSFKVAFKFMCNLLRGGRALRDASLAMGLCEYMKQRMLPPAVLELQTRGERDGEVYVVSTTPFDACGTRMGQNRKRTCGRVAGAKRARTTEEVESEIQRRVMESEHRLMGRQLDTNAQWIQLQVLGHLKDNHRIAAGYANKVARANQALGTKEYWNYYTAAYERRMNLLTISGTSWVPPLLTFEESCTGG